jgi:hypothetical protein
MIRRVPELALRLAELARQHWLLTVLLLAGAVLRGMAEFAYQPVLLYIDSFRYLSDSGQFDPGGLDPIGYEVLLLGPLLLIGNLWLVGVVQHLLGLGLAVAIYALLRRFGVLRWIAALATAPVLLDAYQVQIEHNVMSDLLFQVLLLALVAVLTWRGAPRPRTAMWAGLLLAAAVLVRVVGVTLVVPAAVFVLLAAGIRQPRDGWRQRWRATGALVGAFAALLGVYSLYHMAWLGAPGLTGDSGSAVFGRTAVVADCQHLDLTQDERAVCPDESPAERKRIGIDYYIHFYYPPKARNLSPDQFKAAQNSMAFKVLLHQPGDVFGGVLEDLLKGFAPTRAQAVGDVPLSRWQFQTDYPLFTPEWYLNGWAEVYGIKPSVDKDVAGALRAYQLGGGYTPGTVLGAFLLTGAASVVGVGRARRSGLRAVCLLPTGLCSAVLLTAAALEFSWRYQLPGLVLLPLSAALGVTAMTGWRDRSVPDPVTAPRPLAGFRTEEATMSAFPDAVDRAALDDYEQRYGRRGFAPVVLLIAAYNEAEAIGDVLDRLPTTSCGLEVDPLVVVDGASDDTAEVALRHGAQVCHAPTNRGQGAALRLGYRLAAERGAQYVVTTDADGQYDVDELPQLLRPILDGEADFVTGSRTLGRTESTDLVRRAGTHVFAWIVSALTRQRITDTSFGFRAMRVDVPNSVALEQNQYQSSELLVGVLAHGYRVLEKPMTMFNRTAGRSKKGNNLLYGYRYARVVLGTWLRERRAGRAVARSGAGLEPAVSEPAAVGER